MTESTPSDVVADFERERQRRRLPPASGGGHDGGMPPDSERIGVVENDIKHIKEDVASLKGDVRTIASDMTALKVDFATVKVRIDHLPTKGWAFSSLTAAVVLVAALIALAPIVQRFFGTLPLPL